MYDKLKCPHCGSTDIRFFSDVVFEYSHEGHTIDTEDRRNYWCECPNCNKSSDCHTGFKAVLNEFFERI